VHFDLTSGESVPHPGGDIAEMVCACRCQTEGSEMSHMDGWLLFCSHAPEGGIHPESVGRLSFVRLKNAGVYVARLMRGSRRGRWHLITPHATIRDAEVEWAKPVLMVIP
jgi:hypothetical protein